MRRIPTILGTVIAAALSAPLLFGAAAAQGTVVMRVANVAPDSHPSSVVLREVAEALNQRKDVDIKVEVFNGGVLGGELETLDQLLAGSIQGVVSQAISLYQVYDLKFGVEELPFLFPSREAAYVAVDGEFGDAISERLKEHGFQVLAYWENGSRNFTNSKRPIVKPEDMAGLRFRSAESAIRLDMFKALGASAVAMPFPELYAALQQGVVDGQENPLSIIHNASFADVQDFVSLSGHIWNSAPVVVNLDWWEGLSQEVRTAIQEEFYSAREKQRGLIAAGDEKLIEVLKSQGMTVNKVDVPAFQEAAAVVWENWTQRIGEDLMELARKIRDGEN